MKFFCVIALAVASSLTSHLLAEEITGRFAPPKGKVLVFSGQDNASVGGTEKHRDGYVENIGIPAGISHYVHLSEGWTNELGHKFPTGSVAGLQGETDWGSGPMNLKAYLDSPMLDRCVIHLSISLAGNSEKRIAAGEFDHLIGELTQLIKDHGDHPFLIRIGHEFGTPGNTYDPENFRNSFRRIVDALRVDKLPNVATVFAAASEVKAGQFEEYDPGSEYYDWIGYTWWGNENDGRYALEFARKVKKPAIITEATPQGHYFNRENHGKIWSNWFEPFFTHIEENIDVVRAISYINTDWDSQEMWEGWGHTKIETAPTILSRWKEKMNEPMYINSVDKPFSHIEFPSPFAVPEKAPVEPYATYKDPEADIAARVADLLGRMTLEEKVVQLCGWADGDERTLRREGAIFTKEFYANIAPHGIGEIGPVNLNIEEDIRQYTAIQEYFLRDTRLGIPAIRNGGAAHGLMKLAATSFPCPIALSCSWNPELIEKIYRHAGREARSRGILRVHSPNLNLARDLRWGQIDETLGEDPYLAGRLGASIIAGLQGGNTGTIAPGHVAATAKHFAGSGNTEGGRNLAPYAGGKRQLLDNEIEVFRYSIKSANPAAIMAGLHELDGVPCPINPWLLKDVLRNDLDFAGLLTSDHNALQIIQEYHGIGKSPSDIAAMAIEAGLQLDMPGGFGYQNITDLVKQEKLDLNLIDQAVKTVLDLKFRLGLFENPRLSYNLAAELPRSDTTTELAVEAARQSIVLLKNDGLLPLDRASTKKIAVIGPNSDVCRLGSHSGTPRQSVSLLDGIRSFLGEDAEVLHAKGCMIALNDTHDSYLNWRHVNEVNFVSLENNLPLIEEAVALAKQSDVVVLALGENALLGRKTRGGNHLGDRSTLDLTESQVKLANDILATGKPVVLHLVHGKPITLGDLGVRCNSIVTGHYTGQESGTAAAEILFGETNPSGKLTVSWPRSVGHLPAHYNRQRTSAGFDYIDSPQSAVYPFGYGLSYTSFNYTNPTLSKEAINPGESVEVRFELTNTGERRGTEVSQLYVSGEKFRIARPGLELKGFQRVTLDPGETQVVTFVLTADDLFFHDADLKRVLPGGQYRIRVGGSSNKLSEPVLLRTGDIEPEARPTPPENRQSPENMTSNHETNPTAVATPDPNLQTRPAEVTQETAKIDINPENIRQTIDGFGGSIAPGSAAFDEEALQVAINGLNTRFIRAQGEVSPRGEAEPNRDVLQRAMKINPYLEVLLTFWQPRSLTQLDTEYWLNQVEMDGGTHYELKPEREAEWADEMVSRIKRYREWGIRITTVSVQNESNLSVIGTQSCRWEPDRLADFIEKKLRPALDAAGMEEIRIAAPDLAFIGYLASEIDRFIPTLTSRAVDVATYHMNDGFKADTKSNSLTPLIKNSASLSALKKQYFSEKRLWMTETAGARRHGKDQPTYGWIPQMTEHQKAIKAARYLHSALVDAEANAFLWRNLICSIPPETEPDPQRDEGLVLVKEKESDGSPKFLERTGKFYTFRQYSGFVKPGFRRIQVEPLTSLHLSAFLSPDESVVVSIVINDSGEESRLNIEGPGGMKIIGSFQTDSKRRCSPVEFDSLLPPESVRTMVFSK